MKVLVVCSANVNRSPTVEKHLNKKFPKHEFRSAGTYHGYPYQVNKEILEWAEKIFVMDLSHKIFIHNKYPEHESKVDVLGISDEYDRDDPYLHTLVDFWLKDYII